MEEAPKKDTMWGWFREYHRITMSKWFIADDELGKKGILMALDSRYPISTARYKAVLTAFYTTIIYAMALGVWGLVFKQNILWFGIGGAILGFLIGLVSASVIAGQRTIERANDIQFAASAIWGNIGIVFGIVGLAALILRIVFFTNG